MAEAGGLGRTGIILITFIAISVIIVIALQALHLYRSNKTNNDEATTNDVSPTFELPEHDYLRQTFPGHFHTDTEIEDLAKSSVNLSALRLNMIDLVTFDFLPHFEGQVYTTKMVEMHTCCCKIYDNDISYKIFVGEYKDVKRSLLTSSNRICFPEITPSRTTSFISPPTAVDVNGINRTLANFGGTRQIFYTEKCTQAGGIFQSCTCRTLPVLNSGVYVIDARRRRYGIAYFNVGNTCVGLNT